MQLNDNARKENPIVSKASQSCKVLDLNQPGLICWGLEYASSLRPPEQHELWDPWKTHGQKHNVPKEIF